MTDNPNPLHPENTEDRQSAQVGKFIWKRVVAVASILAVFLTLAILLYHGVVSIDNLVQDIKRTESLEIQTKSLENQIRNHSIITYNNFQCLKVLMENSSDNTTGSCLISDTFSIMDDIVIKVIYGRASTSVATTSVGQQ